MCYSEHPRSIYVGVEADDWKTLKEYKNDRTGGKNFPIMAQIYYKALVYMTNTPGSFGYIHSNIMSFEH